MAGGEAMEHGPWIDDLLVEPRHLPVDAGEGLRTLVALENHRRDPDASRWRATSIIG